jgi:hypothetical protein
MLLHGQEKAETGVVDVWNIGSGRQRHVFYPRVNVERCILVQCEKLYKMLLAKLFFMLIKCKS